MLFESVHTLLTANLRLNQPPHFSLVRLASRFSSSTSLHVWSRVNGQHHQEQRIFLLLSRCSHAVFMREV